MSALRLTLSLLGCRLTVLTGADTEESEPDPAGTEFAINTTGSHDPAPVVEPYPEPTDFGFGRPPT